MGVRRLFAAWPDSVVTRLKVQQRLAAPYHDVLDLGDEDGVVASVLRSLQATFEIGQRTV